MSHYRRAPKRQEPSGTAQTTAQMPGNNFICVRILHPWSSNKGPITLPSPSPSDPQPLHSCTAHCDASCARESDYRSIRRASLATCDRHHTLSKQCGAETRSSTVNSAEVALTNHEAVTRNRDCTDIGVSGSLGGAWSVSAICFQLKFCHHLKRNSLCRMKFYQMNCFVSKGLIQEEDYANARDAKSSSPFDCSFRGCHPRVVIASQLSPSRGREC